MIHALMFGEQAKPQTLYTQILNYNPPKALQFNVFVFTILVYVFVWFAKLRGSILGILELGSGVGHVVSVEDRLYYVGTWKSLEAKRYLILLKLKQGLNLKREAGRGFTAHGLPP